jgi:membrane protein
MAPEGFDADEPGRGRLAAGPWDIPARGWRDILWRVVLEIGADRLPSVAGGVTFFALLAIFPAIGAFVSLYGLFADIATVQTQLQQMSGVFPASVVQIVGDQMLRLAGEREGRLTVALILSLVLSTWSANNGVRALVEGLNIAYDEDERRPLWKVTLVTYAATFGALVFLALVAGLLVAIPAAMAWLGLAEGLWAPLRWLLVFVLAATAFSLAYRYAPCRARARWRWVTIGAVSAAAVWLAGSLAFSLYMTALAPLDATYGPLGAVIGFMIWVWCSVMVLLLGAELNAEIEHQTALDSTTGPERPLGERGAAMADTVGAASRWKAVVQGGLRRSRDLLAALAQPSTRPAPPAAPPDPRRSEAR